MDWKRNFVNRISSIQSKIRNTIQTRFYYDMEDIDHFVILERTKRILLANDITRGYVDRRWVFDKFKHAIHPIRLTKRSCLVEYLVKTNQFPIEMCRVYVR